MGTVIKHSPGMNSPYSWLSIKQHHTSKEKHWWQLHQADCWQAIHVCCGSWSPISCKLDLTIQEATTVPQCKDRIILELHNPWVGGLVHIDSGRGLDLSDVLFTTYASDKQYGKHLLLDYAGPFAVSLLCHQCTFINHAPWYLWLWSHVSQPLM